jgi:hypothetical protein
VLYDNKTQGVGLPVFGGLLAERAHGACLDAPGHCNSNKGLSTISAALKLLQKLQSAGPNTINVSGACNENILITDIDRLTITGGNGASLTDATGGAADVGDIRNSRVTITGMTIDGQNGQNGEQFTRATSVSRPA